jgi:hypothetical protein
MAANVNGCVPVQGQGVHRGHPWYFRARYNSWQFYIAEAPDTEAVKLSLRFNPISGWAIHRLWIQEDPYGAGYMPHRKAVRLIETCLRWFDAGKLEYVPIHSEPVDSTTLRG